METFESGDLRRPALINACVNSKNELVEDEVLSNHVSSICEAKTLQNKSEGHTHAVDSSVIIMVIV